MRHRLPSPSILSRREFAAQSLGSLLTFTLLDMLLATDALADEVKPVTVKWVADVNQMALDLKEQRFDQLAWQQKTEELFAQVDLEDLLRLIDFERLTTNLKLVDSGARSLSFRFREIEGVPTKLAFGRQIFALKEGRSVVPHGHNNMATAFLILRGDFHGRHFDRVEDEKGYYLIRPTIDRQFGPGECSTISDYKDNVHWFTAKTGPAFILNVHVLDVKRDGTESTGRVYLDPQGEKLADGLIRARRLSYKEVHQVYG
jgi:hypothetical protein